MKKVDRDNKSGLSDTLRSMDRQFFIRAIHTVKKKTRNEQNGFGIGTIEEEKKVFPMNFFAIFVPEQTNLIHYYVKDGSIVWNICVFVFVFVIHCS